MIGQRHLAGNPRFPPVQVVLARFYVRVSDPTHGRPKPPQGLPAQDSPSMSV